METVIQQDHKLLDKAEAYVKDVFESNVPETFVYHNFNHTIRVRDDSRIMATKAALSQEEIEILELAALFHDTGFSRALEDHEFHSQRIAEEFLKGENYPKEKIDRVLACIEATRVQNKPETKLQEIIKDADMSNLGKKDYFDEAEKLRIELNTVFNENLDEDAWAEVNLNFQKDHKFFTDEANALYGKRKKKNIKKLEQQLGLRAAKTIKASIASNKSAQTQFKTALRNHIDLSAIADNKANIMLSVNALIISISLPMLGERIIKYDETAFIAPTIMLLGVCITSIIYATLATRPIRMSGSSNLDDVLSKRSNLFFFGNFYKMSFQEYEDGMRAVVSNDDILDNSIMRDLFFLGKALGKKYYYLRLCYNIFMFGMIITVLLFTVFIAIGSSGAPIMQ